MDTMDITRFDDPSEHFPGSCCNLHQNIQHPGIGHVTKEMSCGDMQCNEMEILYLCMYTPQKINMEAKIT